MKQKLLSLLLCFVMLFCYSLPVWAEEEVDQDYQQQIEENAEAMGMTEEEYTKLLQDTMFNYYLHYIKTIQTDYKFDISMEELYQLTIKALVGVDPKKLELAISSVFSGLDANSQYFDAQSYPSFTQKLDDSMIGVGIIIANLEERIVITGFPVENSPAELAGVCAGDEIVSVDGIDVRGKNINELGTFIRGEAGTTVTLGLLRDGQEISLTLTRVEIKQNNVKYEFLDGGILSLKLSSFNQGCSQEVKKALDEADKRNVKKVILDLRNNTGGLGSEAYAIASMFLPKGTPIATIEYKDETLNEVHVSTGTLTAPKYQVALLVNEYSASASELLAAAFQDNQMGVLIGTNTYGKGTGQQIYPLNAFDSGYKLTVCQYVTPDGSYLPASGLLPDIKVENPLVFVNKSKEVPQINMERKLYVGDQGEDVRACQIRLEMLGYPCGNVEGRFDQKTAGAVAKFQEDTGLFPCGDLDHVTQSKLYVKSSSLQIRQDDQMTAAIDYFSE